MTVELSFADDPVQQAAKGKQHTQFAESHIKCIHPETAANVQPQLPAYQKCIKQRRHKHAQKGVAFDRDPSGQIHTAGGKKGCQRADNRIKRQCAGKAEVKEPIQ